MLRYENQRFENVRHFYGAIATQIRRIIIDHARKHRPETLNMDGEIPGKDGALWRGDIAALIAMVERLEPAFPEEMEAVSLLCFVGCTQEEAATALGTTRSVVEKRFRRAKALLIAGLEA
jgi:DNA-directed RNA polymerase specialized sigma24 family protein